MQNIQDIKAIATDILDILEAQPSLDISIRENLAFAQYQDLTLAIATTEIFPIAKITVKQLEQLYSN